MALADISYLVDIYPAREKPIEGVTSAMIVKDAKKMGHDNFEYLGPKENAIEKIASTARSGDLVITMGAGSVTLLKHEILNAIKDR